MDNIFDTDREIVKDYIQYLIDRSDIWKQKYVDRKNIITYPNEVLEKYHLCNIWRELDRFSQEEINRLSKAKSLKDKILIIFLGRHNLSYSTTDLLLKGCSLEDLYIHWEECKKDPNKQFVGNAIQMYPKPGMDRAKTVYEHAIQVYDHIYHVLDYVHKDPHELFNLICSTFDHVGPFRAYEMITSLTYCPEIHFTEHTLAYSGPGSINNLKLISNRDIKNEKDAEVVLKELANEVQTHLILEEEDFFWIPEKWQGNQNHTEQFKFTPRTLEDSFCEFRKYQNFLGNKGRRRIYNSDMEV